MSIGALAQRTREHLKAVLAETPLFDGRTSVLQVTDATGGTVRVRILVTAKAAPTPPLVTCGGGFAR